MIREGIFMSFTVEYVNHDKHVFKNTFESDSCASKASFNSEKFKEDSESVLKNYAKTILSPVRDDSTILRKTITSEEASKGENYYYMHFYVNEILIISFRFTENLVYMMEENDFPLGTMFEKLNERVKLKLVANGWLSETN